MMLIVSGASAPTAGIIATSEKSVLGLCQQMEVVRPKEDYRMLTLQGLQHCRVYPVDRALDQPKHTLAALNPASG